MIGASTLNLPLTQKAADNRLILSIKSHSETSPMSAALRQSMDSNTRPRVDSRSPPASRARCGRLLFTRRKYDRHIVSTPPPPGLPVEHDQSHSLAGRGLVLRLSGLDGFSKASSGLRLASAHTGDLRTTEPLRRSTRNKGGISGAYPSYLKPFRQYGQTQGKYSLSRYGYV